MIFHKIKNKIKKEYKRIGRCSIEKEAWILAIRRNHTPLYTETGNGNGFLLISNSIRYWRADPFIYKYKGEEYIFAEMFDRILWRGVIGVAKIKNGHCGRFHVCLKESFHLSYPCVFEENGEIWMMPECGESGEIIYYKSIAFPMKWKKHESIGQYQAVDTTPLFNADGGGATWYFTTINDSNGINSNLFLMKGKNSSLVPLFINDKKVRCAGHFICDGNDLIRPAQNDDGLYGNSFSFNQVRIINGLYSENRMFNVYPSKDFCGSKDKYISVIDNKKEYKFLGTHTYNYDDSYEVIDLTYRYRKNIIILIRNILSKFITT